MIAFIGRMMQCDRVDIRRKKRPKAMELCESIDHMITNEVQICG